MNIRSLLSEIRYLGEVTDSMLDTTEFEVLRTGTFYDPRYGTFEVTPTMLQNIQSNFMSNILGVEIAVDKNHEWGDGAVAWVKSLRCVGDKLYATFKDYTEEGKKLFKEKIFKYFSVEFAPFEKVSDNGDRTTVMDVLRGIAVTNRPVIKGMQPAFLSESLSLNIYRMDKFRQFSESLKGKDKISKEDLSMLKGMFAMLSEEEQQAASQEVADAEAKVEAPAEPVAPAPEATPAEPAKSEDKELSEKKTLAEVQDLKNQVKALSEQNAKNEAKLKEKELSETFEGALMLSEATKVGFQKDAKEEVVAFMKLLSEDALAKFKALVPQVRNLDIATLGASVMSSARVETADEEAVLALSEKLLSEGKAKDIREAQNMALAELSK